MISSVLLAALIAAAQSTNPDAPAVVSGRVVDAITRRPIASAVVIPYGTAARVPADDGGMTAAPRALTNANGAFVIRGLRPGSLILHAAKGGYVDAAYGQTRPGGYGRTLTITPGARVLDLEIWIWHDGVITGTVTDETGDPAVGVRVVAYTSGHTAGIRWFSTAASALTDDRGVYRIPHLRPGAYLVGVPSTVTSLPGDVNDVFFARTASRGERDQLGREMKTIDAPVVPAGSRYAATIGGIVVPLAPGTATPTARADGAMLVYPTVFFPAGTSASLAGLVSLGAGEERGNIDLQVQLVRSARVSGVLAGPPEMTSHVAVRLIGVGNESVNDGLDTAATITDSAGTFAFLGVPPGDYLLSITRAPRQPIDARDDDRLTVQTQGVSIAPRAAPADNPPPPPVTADATLWARVPVTVSEQDLNDIIVPLRAGARLTGRVVFEGTIEPPDRAIVQRIGITLDPMDAGSATRALGLEVGHPDADESFRTVGVPPGRYLLGMTSPPLGQWLFEGASYRGRDIAAQSIDLGDTDLADVVLTFTDRPATIEGRVQTTGDASRSGDALVIVYPIDANTWPSAGGSPRHTWAVRASSTGTYTIANVLPGEYYVVAIDRDAIDWADERLLRSLARSADRVAITEGDHKVVILRALAVGER